MNVIEGVVSKINSGRYETALEDLDKLESELGSSGASPGVDRVWVWAARGFIWLQRGRYQSAELCYGKAIELAPGNPSLYEGRAVAREHLGNRGADKDFGAAIRLEPGNAKRWRDRAYFYWGVAQRGAAMADMAKALELAPGDAANYLARGYMFYCRGRRELAESDLRKVFELEARGPNRCHAVSLMTTLQVGIRHEERDRPRDRGPRPAMFEDILARAGKERIEKAARDLEQSRNDLAVRAVRKDDFSLTLSDSRLIGSESLQALCEHLGLEVSYGLLVFQLDTIEGSLPVPESVRGASESLDSMEYDILDPEHWVDRGEAEWALECAEKVFRFARGHMSG